LAETYAKIAGIYARIANLSLPAKQAAAPLPPSTSTAKSGASLSAYMLFAADQRDIIRSENPGLSSAEQIEVISTAWKAASNDLRERYIGLIEKSSPGSSNVGGGSSASAEPAAGMRKRTKGESKTSEAAAKKKEPRKTKPTVNGTSAST
ncbi:hypothetical protein GGI20_005400, partial [Coemansia sp. BCRC 34301]